MNTIAVLGAGGWGIALANYCSGLGHRVALWEFDPDEAERLRHERTRSSVLPGVPITAGITITADLQQALDKAEVILLVVPSHIVRSVLRQVATIVPTPQAIMVNCAKGIENGTQMRMSEVFAEELPGLPQNHYAVLSGPSHAEEVSRQIPTAVVVAAISEEIAASLQKMLVSKSFRLYRSRDVVGVELGGALKNVIAIAAGICDGAGFGDNSKAALQPRGLAEIARLGRKLGAEPLTFAGLSGMGDLIVTCMSRHSRNRYLGEQLGLGRKLDEVLNSMKMVAEGVRTCRSAVALSHAFGVELPICQQVYHILFEGREPRTALEELMNREIKPEVWF